MLSETLPLLLSDAPEVSVTVAVHIMVSALPASAAVSVIEEPVPKAVPELIFVQAKLEDSESPSSSLALTEQVRVLSLLGVAGLMATALIAGSVLDTVSADEELLPVSVPSSAVTVTVMDSPLSK